MQPEGGNGNDGQLFAPHLVICPLPTSINTLVCRCGHMARHTFEAY